MNIVYEINIPVIKMNKKIKIFYSLRGMDSQLALSFSKSILVMISLTDSEVSDLILLINL